MTSKQKKAVSEAVSTLAFVLALLIGLLVIFPRIMRTDTPLAVVSSWSMEPTLHIGDIIVVSGWGEIKVGDIVVYLDNRGSLIVHRVIAIEESDNGILYITKGDANPFADAPVHPHQIKGKVVLVIPYLGVLKLALERALISSWG